MKYSQELIWDVKRLYPESSKMQELAESGEIFLGRYLDDGAPRGFPIDEILLATSLDSLQGKARVYKEKVNLYSKWMQEYHKQYPPK